MQLSERLLAVAGMVKLGNRVVDVGTDHGYIPIYLVQEKKVPSAIAMDIRTGPLSKAKANVTALHMEEVIQTRLSDGVQALKENEADTLIIAGMGGGLIRKIIEDGRVVLESVEEFILQPQSEIGLVRRFLANERYCIIEEDMVFEDGKFYPMMRVIRGCMFYDREIFFKYGKLLLEHKNLTLKQFLEKEKDVYLKLREQLLRRQGSNIADRLCEIEQELEYINEASFFYS